jgi:hypothetical protein
MRLGTVASVVLALAVGAGVGLWIRRTSAAPSDEDARVAELEREAEALRREKAAASVPVTGPGAPPAAGDPKPPPPAASLPGPDPNKVIIVTPADVPIPGEPEPTPPKHLIRGHEEALAAVDWSVVGKNLAAMMPVASRLAAAMEKPGSIPPPDLIGRLGELNGPLVAAAIKVRDKTGVSNANGAFTHPAFMVNAIVATLEAAGKPLTDDQDAHLVKAAELYTAREKARVDAYESHVFALEKVIDEGALRDDFFTAAEGILKPEQRAVLWPPGTKGRLGVDVFSSGLLWTTVAQPLPFKDRDVLVSDVADVLVNSFSLAEDRRPVARAAAVEFVNAFPAAELDTKVSGLSTMGLLPTPLVRDAAKRWLAALQRVVREGRLDEETTVRIRGYQPVTVPIRIE